MHLSALASLGLALGALAGSRFWEVPAADLARSQAKRAISLAYKPHDKEVNRLWPDKTLSYCFAEEDEDKLVPIRGLWNLGIESWPNLKDHGFSYKELSKEECRSKRSTSLVVHYNDQGKLRSTIGIPRVGSRQYGPDSDYEGPFSHISDNEEVGQLDAQANIAHELGHVWGLVHEHQNVKWWKKDSLMGPVWPQDFSGDASKAKFATDDFDCQALADYEDAMRRAREAAARDEEAANDPDLLCTARGVASKYNFGAADWVPYNNGGGLSWDDAFDPESLMLYPSGSGGVREGDSRRTVMRYANGDLIPPHTVPSHRDWNKLVQLYGEQTDDDGDDDGDDEPELHSSKSSGFRSKFRKVFGKNKKAGHTSEGLC